MHDSVRSLVADSLVTFSMHVLMPLLLQIFSIHDSVFTLLLIEIGLEVMACMERLEIG